MVHNLMLEKIFIFLCLSFISAIFVSLYSLSSHCTHSSYTHISLSSTWAFSFLELFLTVFEIMILFKVIFIQINKLKKSLFLDTSQTKTHFWINLFIIRLRVLFVCKSATFCCLYYTDIQSEPFFFHFGIASSITHSSRLPRAVYV